jgi:D-beta-D-heptose 7-phosphate kinase / D-beta-D-heptose 1-phosphate adenosyltransferase
MMIEPHMQDEQDENIPNIQELFDSMSFWQNTTVVVLGDIILDEYIEGAVSRISPEAPVPVLNENKRTTVLGGAANVAANTASLKAKTFLIGRVGQDRSGENVVSLCKAQKIDHQFLIKCKNTPTICKTRVISGYQQLLRIDNECIVSLKKEDEEFILQNLRVLFQQVHKKICVVISDYGKGFFNPQFLKNLISLLNEFKIPSVVDPKSADLSVYSGTTLLKPNLSEALDTLKNKGIWKEKGMSSEFGVVSLLPQIARHLATSSGVKCVVLSLSELGVVFFESKNVNKFSRFKSTALQVADVSGAGDTMVAVLAIGAACETPLPQSVYLSNLASGIVCGKLGTSTTNQKEIIDVLNKNHMDLFGVSYLKSLKCKTSSENEALKIVETLKFMGKKIVFTNGCFDIFHAGHAQILKQIRQEGDFLIVGLNSDESVRRLKGSDRPINSLFDRAVVLEALESVNLVIPFEQNTPLHLINLLKPDVLAKGGDYKIQDVVGWKEVTELGGKVVIFPLLEGRSSSNVIKQIKKGS